MSDTPMIAKVVLTPPETNQNSGVPLRGSKLSPSPNSLTVPTFTRRKLSIPTSLNLSGGGEGQQIPIRRRFSHVGDAARKLSTTIGFRTGLVSGPPSEEIIAVGRAMCTLYIRTKLKRAGLFNKKLGLSRVRSAVGSLIGCNSIVRDVFPGLSCACGELERMYPKLYTKISRYTGTKASDPGNVGLLLAIGHDMLRTEPTWGKIVAIYCIAAGLAVDYVRQGQPEQLHLILEDMSELLEDRIAFWVQANGGWTGLSAHCKPKNQEVSTKQYLTIFSLVTVIFLIAYILVRFVIKFGI